MTEFLTENARRAYPLEREWPSGMEAWSRILVDAAVATDATLGSGRMALLSVERSGSRLTFTVGAPGTMGIPVTFDRATWTGGRTAVAYASGVAAEDDTVLLPYQATLDYVQSTGQQYVDTGVNPATAPTAVADMQILDNADRDYWGNGGAGVNATSIYIADFANKRLMYYRYASGSVANPVCTSSGARETWSVGKEISINGNPACFTSPNTYAYDARQPSIRIFASARGNPSVFKLYSFKLYEGNDLVRHLIPVLDWSDEPRLFDLVTQTYMAHADLTAAHVPLLGGAVVAVTPLDATRAGRRVKALLTLNVEAVDALLADPDETGGEVGVPFAMRCSGGAIRRVTAITAQGAPPCEKPMYDPDGPHGVEKSVGANEHATLAAYDGIDLEVTSMLPLEGDMLRISAIAAPEAADVEQEPIDLMIRGDECFEVEAVPSADKKSGIVRVTSTCKPCCQCEDYKDAVDMLRPAENKVHSIHQVLNAAKAAYEGALATFNEAKARYVEQVNSPANVLVSATAALSGGLYAQSTAEGSRMRITITMLVENMTMVDVQVAVEDDPDDESDSEPKSGFVVGDGYVHSKTVWTKSGTPQEYDEGRPREPRTLKPGDTLTVAATYCKPNQRSNNASRPPGMKAYCTIQLPGQKAVVREVDVQ